MNACHSLKFAAVPAILLAVSGCSSAPKSPDVSSDIRKSFDQAGLKNVSVSQDRDKGVITLGGQVASDAAKAEADSLAKADAAGQVVADEIAVIPPGNNDVKTVNSDLDSAIGKNLDAALIERHLDKRVHYDVKNGVVKLTGDLKSESRRDEAGKVATGVPNVQQVVNEIQIKDQKATSNN
jgi:hyperosmotically inducible periplasmic protein